VPYLEVLEQTDQTLRTQGVRVLGSDLHHDLEVASDVPRQHLLQHLVIVIVIVIVIVLVLVIVIVLVIIVIV
jgi:hypothetical protein